MVIAQGKAYKFFSFLDWKTNTVGIGKTISV